MSKHKIFWSICTYVVSPRNLLAFPNPSPGKATSNGIGDDAETRMAVYHRGTENPHSVHKDTEPLASAYLPARANAVLESWLFEFYGLAQGIGAVHEQDALSAAVASIALEHYGEGGDGLVHIAGGPEDIGRIMETGENGGFTELPRLGETHACIFGLEVKLNPGISLCASHGHSKDCDEEAEYENRKQYDQRHIFAVYCT